VRCTQLWQPRDHDTYKDIAISGSYDHTIRIWNIEDDKEDCLGILDHGAPVEALLLMSNPSGNSPWLLSAGGKEIKIWNFLTGKCHNKVRTQHAKTITSLVAMTRKEGETKLVWRILTAALDGLIRIHSWNDVSGEIKFVHGVKTKDPITSLAFNESNSRMAIGTSTGVVCVRQIGASVTQKKRNWTPQAGTYSFFRRGMNVNASEADFVVKEKGLKRQKLMKHDLAIKQFRYGDAIDEAVMTKIPQFTVGVVEELGRRRGLISALSSRDESNLEPILSFIAKNIAKPQYTSKLIGLANTTCDIYGGVIKNSEPIGDMFGRLKKQVREECAAQKNLLSLMGQIDALAAVQKHEKEIE